MMDGGREDVGWGCWEERKKIVEVGERVENVGDDVKGFEVLHNLTRYI